MTAAELARKLLKHPNAIVAVFRFPKGLVTPKVKPSGDNTTVVIEGSEKPYKK